MDRRTFFNGAAVASAAFLGARKESAQGELRESIYAVVELLGYKKLCGRLSQGIAGLLQLDVPIEGGFSTQFINPASVYRITVCDEQTVRELSRHTDPLPTIALEIQPTQRHLDWQEREDAEF